ncbi:MAG: hypothetical protein JWO04_572 [Gammaproteobacteria bacterium]|nr:hypothetical protein [Gammaproteobacteria bacterium]
MKIRINAISLMLLLAASAAIAHAGVPGLRPAASGDDTAQLQAALTRCAEQHHACDIRLGAGVFHTDVLLVQEFKGSITGAGEGRTTIRPILSRPLRSTRTPFFAEPTLDEPYPVLLHFADGGRVVLKGFTLEFPSGMTVAPYDYYLFGSDGLNITNFLLAAVLVEGDRSAELVTTHVRVIGTDIDNFPGNNLANAIRLQGKQRFSGDVSNYTDRTRKLTRGTFVAHDDQIVKAANGLWLEDANHVNALIYDNQVHANYYGIIFTNLGDSRAQALSNQVLAGSDGIILYQTRERPPEDPSSYVIALNRISAEGEAYDGIAMVDDAALIDGLTGTIQADVDVWGNDIRLLGADVTDGIEIFADGPGDVRVFGNRIRGTPLDSGIWVENSEGTFVAGNDLSGINPSKGDVSLRETSFHCRVIEPGDTVLNLGVDNHVIGQLIASPTTVARASVSALQANVFQRRVRRGLMQRP